ncbi:TIGR03745 family integrating conjugative element membrane protein [Salinicola sp. LHM]|uniref:TIGR03745 family integrating conjugative element membrane protein n=1 Tax=Halomonadaceae TaxID=28256 RepID=UPI00068A2E3C|nr:MULTISPECIES: TIGR03745 family integrating conjugative element membrane protein [Halomonadaceae]MDF9434646.1 TIGR03745 family integrating conjugative element membrane protein [Chromohalobacter israelensis]WQH33466.1 TIGR03745 family integrating conjugative element membrane protein [Salinicola sp. LHM]
MNVITSLYSRTKGVLRGGVAALASLPAIALAALPQQENITEGADGNLLDTFRNVGSEGFSIAFIVVTAFAILAYIGALIWAFNESRKKGEWGLFGMVAGLGVVMIVVVIWLANYGDPIMQST